MSISNMTSKKQRIAIVYATVPSAWEIDQFFLLASKYDVEIVAAESICRYIADVSRFHNLTCRALPDYDENPSYMPGLENLLVGYDVVLVKERLGLYAYQAVKAKLKHGFRLGVMIDNLAPFPCDDLIQIRVVREEITSAADFFIVQTDFAREILLLEGIAANKILALPVYLESYGAKNPLDRRSALSKLGLQSDDFVVSYIGPIENEEGLFELLHGIKIFQSGNPGIAERLKLLICGFGSAMDTLKHRIGMLDLERFVKFMNPTRAGYEAIARGTNLLFYGSVPTMDRVDGDPYRLLYAMVHEIPVLASRSPVIENTIGKQRFDFCQGSPVSLAAALERVFNSRTLLHNLAKKNLTMARKINQEAPAREAMLKLFSGVCQQIPRIDLLSVDHQLMKIEQLIKDKSYVDAVDLLDPLLKMDGLPAGTLAEILRLVGDCFTKLGDAKSGHEAYEKAIALHPKHAKAYIGLGTIALMQQENNQAIILFQKAVGFSPSDDMANLGLGLAFQGLEEFHEAEKWILKALTLNPVSTFGIYTLMSIAGRTKRYEHTRDALERYLQLVPQDANMMYALAGIYFGAGRRDDASKLVDSILAGNPQDSRALDLKNQLSTSSTLASGKVS